jgi:hypothetical protein
MEELYQAARHVLLDALEALGQHREAVILVGAQAIYLRVGDANLAVAPYTSDGDLVLDPARLALHPALEQALGQAGFVLGADVGIWRTARPVRGVSTSISVDLLVPRSVSPAQGRRAARLEGHHPNAALIVEGLEGALVDHDLLELGALRSDDARRIPLKVAGPGALLLAKLKKLSERRGGPRLKPKDALDVLRLLRGVEAEVMLERLSRLLAHPDTQQLAAQGCQDLRFLFGEPDAEGCQWVIQATVGLEDPDELSASCAFLTQDLLASLKR